MFSNNTYYACSLSSSSSSSSSLLFFIINNNTYNACRLLFCRTLTVLSLPVFLGVRRIAKSDHQHRHSATRVPVEGFSWDLIFEHSSKLCLENSSLLKRDKKNGYFTLKSMYIYISLNYSQKEKYLRQKLYRKSKHILSSVTFFPQENPAVHETMWKNMVAQSRPQKNI
jgi:hypothetical protein